MIIPIGNPRWQPSWKSIFCFFYCTEMPVDSKAGRRHWGWLILLVTFWKFQHFNLVSKIFQKLFKPLPCHKSIGKMLHAICISAVAVSLRWASCGPWASCFSYRVDSFSEGNKMVLMELSVLKIPFTVIVSWHGAVLQVSSCHGLLSVIRPSLAFHIFDISSRTLSWIELKLSGRHCGNIVIQNC